MYLNFEQLLAIHVLAIQETGGANGIRDIGPLESAIAAQEQAVFGEELYPTIFEKAAALALRIIAGHPFVDGNKRTAMLAALTLLQQNKVVFRFATGELEDFAVRIAVEHLEIGTIAAWLEQHTTLSTTGVAAEDQSVAHHDLDSFFGQHRLGKEFDAAQDWLDSLPKDTDGR